MAWTNLPTAWGSAKEGSTVLTSTLSKSSAFPFGINNWDYCWSGGAAFCKRCSFCTEVWSSSSSSSSRAPTHWWSCESITSPPHIPSMWNQASTSYVHTTLGESENILRPHYCFPKSSTPTLKQHRNVCCWWCLEHKPSSVSWKP